MPQKRVEGETGRRLRLSRRPKATMLTLISLINKEWMVEKSRNSINLEGGFLFCGEWNFSKLVCVGPTFIREMRVSQGHT